MLSKVLLASCCRGLATAVDRNLSTRSCFFHLTTNSVPYNLARLPGFESSAHTGCRAAEGRPGARRSARGDTDACSEDELGGSAAPSSAKRAGVALAGRPDSRKRMRGRGQDSADAGDAAAQMIAAAARHVPAPAAGLHTRGDGMDTANEGGDSTADAQGTGRLETEGL